MTPERENGPRINGVAMFQQGQIRASVGQI